MRIFLRERGAGEIEFGIIFGLIAVLALAAARFLPIADMMPVCAFKAFTGFPCPTCGSTRSLIRLAHGDLHGSLLLNPVFASAMVLAILWLPVNSVSALFRTSRMSLALTRRESNIVRAAALVIALLNWTYLGLSR